MKLNVTSRLKPGLAYLLTVVLVISAGTQNVDKIESTSPQSPSYSVEQITAGNATEYRFKLDNRHFGTLIDQEGTYALRSHPGCDRNGWGSTWYAQPFLSGATLKHTTIGAAGADPSGIHIYASGMVSYGASSTYGTWSSLVDYVYSPIGQVITGTGQYTITLPGLLANMDKDLNLYKLASNYLDDVPLLSGGNGDTGDMSTVIVEGDDFSFIWDPPILPSHFPTDKTALLAIEVVGQYNNVDTRSMGYAPIAPAFKPGIKVVFTSQRKEMMFGGFYNLAERQCFWCDNIGITPLISKTSPETEFRFSLVMESIALESCRYLPFVIGP